MKPKLVDLSFDIDIKVILNILIDYVKSHSIEYGDLILSVKRFAFKYDAIKILHEEFWLTTNEYVKNSYKDYESIEWIKFTIYGIEYVFEVNGFDDYGFELMMNVDTNSIFNVYVESGYLNKDMKYRDD